jgi:hypothetical protein
MRTNNDFVRVGVNKLKLRHLKIESFENVEPLQGGKALLKRIKNKARGDNKELIDELMIRCVTMMMMMMMKFVGEIASMHRKGSYATVALSFPTATPFSPHSHFYKIPPPPPPTHTHPQII